MIHIHRLAEIDQPATLGDETFVWHFSHVMAGASIGNHCVLGQNVHVASHVVIGNGCKIQNNVSLCDGVTLEDGVFVGPSAVFTNVLNPRAFIERKSEHQKTLVKKGASIGANATIVCGHTIGEYASVAAGAVVTEDVGANVLVAGNPAKTIGTVCKCGEILSLHEQPDFSSGGVYPGAKITCARCNETYTIYR